VTLKQYLQERPVLFFMLLGALFLLTSCSGRSPESSWFGVAADDEAVYLAANEQIFALDLETGNELWAFPTEPDKEIGSFYATPLLKQNQLIAGDFKYGKLYAISQDNGRQEWEVELGERIVGGAAAANGGFIVGDNEGQVYLVQDRNADPYLEADKSIWAIPLVDVEQGRVYIASMNHFLYAMDLETGAQIWAFEADGAIAGAPDLRDGLLYFGTLASTLYAIDAETGAEQWTFGAQGWLWGGPLVHQDAIYFGDMAGNLYALDANEGRELWTFEAQGGIRVKPLVAGDLIYFGTRDKKVYAVRVDDGGKAWSQPVDGAVYSQPVISDNKLLLALHSAKVKLAALDIESGAELWSYPQEE
jgi:outer membrane protein assembly factor BamB